MTSSSVAFWLRLGIQIARLAMVRNTSHFGDVFLNPSSIPLLLQEVPQVDGRVLFLSCQLVCCVAILYVYFAVIFRRG